MKYLKLCETEELNKALFPTLRMLSGAIADYKAITGRNGFEPVFYRGMSRVYCEYDAIYLPIDDEELARFLTKRGEFVGLWRAAGRVRIIEQLGCTNQDTECSMRMFN